MGVDGILFDKDGTLFDFQDTWGQWAAQIIEDLSEGDPDHRAALALQHAGQHRLR